MNDPLDIVILGETVGGTPPRRHTIMKAAGLRVMSGAGFDSRMELGRSDVCGRRGRHVLCLEIELAPNPHVLVNIARDFAQGATFVNVACPDFRTQAAVCRLLDRGLPPAFRHCVSVVTFSLIDFLDQVILSESEEISQRGAGDKQQEHEP